MARGSRLYFPHPILAHASTLDTFKHPPFIGNLDIMHGRVVVYGWYLGMFHALQSDATTVAALWQAALTVSLHVLVVDDVVQLAFKTIQATSLQSQCAKLMKVSFPEYSRTLMIAMETMPVVRAHQ